MKLSFLFSAGLIVSGLVFMSMAYKQEASSVIDKVEVIDMGTSVTTVSFIDRSPGQSGIVVINGTQTTPPVDNNNGGKDYKCRRSDDTCYTCANCELL